MRCSKCNGNGLIDDMEYVERSAIEFIKIKCPHCNGSGDEPQDNRQSPYPDLRPLSEGEKDRLGLNGRD